MKVALCFFGQPRHIENPYSCLSHKYWIIDKYKADVFVHSWISGEEIDFNCADQIKNCKCPVCMKKAKENKDAELILKKYNPKKYTFEEPINFSLDERIREFLREKQKNPTNEKQLVHGSFNYSENNENNHLSQLYSISQSIRLLDEEYDWVILSRFDNYIYDFPSLYLLDKGLYLTSQYYSHFADVLIFGNQEYIKALDCFDKVQNLYQHINNFTPEEFKRVAFQQVYKSDVKNINEYGYEVGTEKRIFIGVGIVRTDSLESLQI